MEVTDETLGMKAAEAEAEMLKGYSALSEDEMHAELDKLEVVNPLTEKVAQELEQRLRILNSALESKIWQGYLEMDKRGLEDEREDLREAKERAKGRGEEGAADARKFNRVEKVLTEMIEAWA